MSQDFSPSKKSDHEALEVLDIEGKSGQPIELPIFSGPATGHAWFLDLPAGVKRIDDGPPRKGSPSSHLGAAEGGCIRVEASAGEHIILARLARPWERDQPVRVVQLRLHVK